MPPKQYASAPSLILDPTKLYFATISTGQGDMVLELFASEAPRAVNSFVFLSREGFHEDGCFHRVIKDFMIQGGCPEGSGRGGPGYRFQDEKVSRPYVKGTLAMANAGPDTNGSQFFIVHGQNVSLPPNYTIFGMLVSGEEVLDALADSPVTSGAGGERSSPSERLQINNIVIHEKEITPAG